MEELFLMNAYFKVKPVTTVSSNLKAPIAMMPLRKNVPQGRNDWQLTTCPRCGRECWYQSKNSEILKQFITDISFLCTECALQQVGQTQEKEKLANETETNILQA